MSVVRSDSVTTGIRLRLLSEPERTRMQVGGATATDKEVRSPEPVPTHQPARRPPRPALFWIGLTVLTVVAAATIPLLYTPRFYFLGDTQIGAFGQWYHLGQKLLSGEWPLLDLQAWHGGNYIAEGQWGLFSPLTMGLGLLATTIEHAVVFVTVVKFVMLAAGAVGAFLLARSYGIPQHVAYVVGVAVTLGGATQYLDAPEWVTSQMVWTLIPYAWWSTRRTMTRNANPLTPLVFGLLTVTVGYVYGTLYLAVVFVACLVDAWVTRNLPGAVRVLLIGACCALVAVTVYLPGVLSASVTTRASWGVLSDGRLQADLPGLLGSMIPTVRSPSSPVPPMVQYPAHYIAWFLPLVAWLDLREARRLLRPAAGLLTVIGVGVLWALGPNQIGPLRWPIRVLPFLSLAVIVFVALCWSRATLRRPPLRRLVLSLAMPLGAAYLIVSRFWADRWMTFVSTLVVVIGLVLLWMLTRWSAAHSRSTRSRSTRSGSAHPAPSARLALFIVGWGVLAMAVQHHYYPFPTAVDRNMPSTISGYSTQASTAKGDVILVGNPEAVVLQNPAAVRDFLIASSWYVNPHPVQNVYSTIGFTAYNDLYGMRFDGATYPWLADELFEFEPRTGMQRVDLLSVSTILLVRSELPEATLLNPPDGWSVSDQTPYAVTWVRDRPLPAAGGIVWASPGVNVTQLSTSTRELRMRVNEAPGDGGTVVLSRLAWPGYSGAGATLAPPTDGYLLTVAVPPGTSGRTVTVRYAPPGWGVEQITGWLGLGIGLLWSLGFAFARADLVRQRRRRAREVVAS
jgi:hypothetical protein